MPLVADSLSSIEPWLRQHGYWVFCLALVLENVLFTSVIVPGLLVLIMAGFWAGSGIFDLRLVLVLGVLSAWLGDSVSYISGRLFWGRLLAKTRFGPSLSRYQPVLEQRGSVFLVLYHFEPVARTLGATLAGSVGLSVRRWLPYDFFGAFLWVTFYTSVGFSLARLGLSLDNWKSLKPVSVIVLIVLLIWGWLLNRAVKRSLSLK